VASALPTCSAKHQALLHAAWVARQDIEIDAEGDSYFVVAGRDSQRSQRSTQGQPPAGEERPQ
jgi:hypothetical protein